MPPADQGLVAGQLAVLQTELRLIVEIELVLAQGAAEIALQTAAFLERRIHGRLEEAEGVAAVFLGAIKREIGVLQQCVVRLGVEGAQGNADAGRGCDLMAVHLVTGAQRIAEAAGKPHGILGRLDLLSDDGELVTAKPADEIDLSNIFLQARGDLLQQRIAGGMAERVVHLLEAVEVETEHRDDVAVALGARDRTVKMLPELHPIGQAGERIVQGQEVDPVLGVPAFTDAPRGDGRRHGEAYDNEEARGQRRHGKRHAGERSGGGLVDGEGIDARNLAVLRDGHEGHAQMVLAGKIGKLDGIVADRVGERRSGAAFENVR
ncbi:hypothetical protein AUC71_12115 [Methyloceanibacter marginalis]|uniref:Uncharacterized protein n=1 Tax=Methyloceanibacter marginalis TaxID=1774971 RepID=A0A1E3WBA0_9HYPH|nr:hypothetical protein AUC71_12115 [Methyloceanibacter marginalis]